MKISSRNRELSVRTRILGALIVGIIVSAILISLGSSGFAAIALFDVTAMVYGVWTWLDIWPMEASATARHALREDSSRFWADVFLLTASLASLVAVGFLIAGASNQNLASRLIQVGIGVLSVIISWALVHTIFALRYARMYYDSPKGGIDFNQEQNPSYSDFAYLAFIIGMTFQVSDTAFQTQAFRKTALGHSLLAYVFGTVIVATTINLIAGLSH
jgi:uncharacterized membrane protein